MKFDKVFTVTSLSVAMVALTFPVNASAQSEDTAPTQKPSSETQGYEDIVVTARRTSESLQNVPVAVTALSGSALADRSVTNLSEVTQSVPNMLSAGSGNGGSAGQFFLRGVGQGDFTVNMDPGVAIYIDGVYYPRTQGANLDLVDVERVEVLRGPQGTLYGKNATGGLISYITRSPDAPERMQAMMEVSSRNGLRGQFSFNRELSDNDTLYIGGSVVGLTQDGWGDVLVAPTNTSKLGLGKGNFNKRQSVSGRLSLLFRPSDALKFTVRGDMTEQNGAGPAVVLLAATPGTTTSNLVSEEQRADIGKFDRFYSDYRPPNDLSLRGISLTGELDLGGATLKSITAYRTLKQSAGLDFDATDKAIANYGQKVWQNQFSQELQLNGSSFDGALDWIKIGRASCRERV